MSGKVLKNSAIYTFVTLLQRSVGFLLLPFYTFYLNPGEYGNLSVILSISNLISLLFLLAIPNATNRFNSIYKDDKNKVKTLWGSNLILILVNTLILGIIIVLLNRWLISPFSKGISFYPYVLIGILTIFFNPLYVFYQSYLQTTENGKKYGANLTLNFIFNTGLILVFVIWFKMGLLGILLANLITAIIFGIYAFIRFIPQIRLKLDRNITKETLRYSLPLIPHSVSFWIIIMIDRVCLNSYKGAGETGLYSVGSQIGTTMNVITSSVNQAYTPWFYELLKKPEEHKPIIARFSYMIAFLYCILALGMALFSKELIHVIASSKYQDSWKIVPITAFACVFLGYYYFFINVVLFEQKTRLVPIVTILSAILSLVLNLVLVPLYGGMGAAFSGLFSYLSVSVIALILSRRVRPDIRFHYGKMYLMVMLCFLLAMFSYLDPYFTEGIFFSIKAILLLAAVFVFTISFKKEIKAFSNKIHGTRKAFA